MDSKRITNLPIRSRQDAMEKLDWYACRWKIELLHKILKSRCRAGSSQFRMADRVVNLLADLSILTWCLFWMTMMNRVASQGSPAVAIRPEEVRILERLVCVPYACPVETNHGGVSPPSGASGRPPGRASDPPPGALVLWRGLAWLKGIALGFQLGAQFVVHGKFDTVGECRSLLG